MTISSTPIYDEMLHRLGGVKRADLRRRALAGLSGAVGGIALLLAALVAAEAIWHFSPTGRTILALLAVGGTFAILLRFLGRVSLEWVGMVQGPSVPELASITGDFFPGVKDRLRNILDVFDEQQHPRNNRIPPAYSPDLIDASFEDLRDATRLLRFTEAVSFERAYRRMRQSSIVVVAAIALFLLPFSGLSSAGYRILHFQEEFKVPAAFALHVSPGNVEIVKGDTVNLAVTVEATHPVPMTLLPREVTLHLRPKGVVAEERITLKREKGGPARRALPDVRQSFEYYVSAGEVETDRFSVSVTDRPIVRTFTIRVVPPRYTGLQGQNLDPNSGDIQALAGSTIWWDLTPSKPLSHAAVMLDNRPPIELQERGSAYSGSFVARTSAAYHFALTDKDGIASTDAIAYSLSILQDQAPVVTISDPGRNIDVTDAMTVPVCLKIHDDFGITVVRLAYRLAQSKYVQPDSAFKYIIVPVSTSLAHPAAPPADGEEDFAWDLGPLGLVPEDVVEYRAEVFDNDAVNGPKIGVSETYLLRLPSIQEVFADADHSQSEATSNLDESLKQAEDLRKEMNDLSEALKKNEQPDWQKQKRAEELTKRYQDLQKKLDETSTSIRSMTDELQKNNILSPETLEKYRELQKVMGELNSPELQAALKKLQESMQNVSPEQLQQAMAQVQFSEENFRRSIERTLNLLKRIQVEEKVDELVKRSKDLAERQGALEKETAGMKENDQAKSAELAQRQEDIGKELESLQQQLADLKGKMEEFPKEMPLKQLDSAQAAANDSALQRSVQQSSQDLQNMKQQRALSNQRQATASMERMSEHMNRMQEQLLNNQMAEATSGLRKSMEDLLELSQREEDLKKAAQSLDPNSQQFRRLAEQQMNLESDLGKVANSMMALSQQSFVITPEMGKAIGKAMSSMNKSMDALDQRSGQKAIGEQGMAMASLNEGAGLVQDALQAMQQGGNGNGAGSLLQQLQRLTAQQQGINVQTQEMGDGKGPTQEQLQQMGRLAAQQDAVRKSLEQLNRESQESGERNRLLGDLQKIADEMKEVVHDIEQSDLSPSTTRQQERILSRLLDAQHSMRERDYEKRRTSVAGVTPVRPSPPDLGATTESTDPARDLLKALDEGYSRDNLELIRRYYEELNKPRK